MLLLLSEFLGGFLSEVTFGLVLKGRVRFPWMGRGNSASDGSEPELKGELGLEPVIFYQDVCLWATISSPFIQKKPQSREHLSSPIWCLHDLSSDPWWEAVDEWDSSVDESIRKAQFFSMHHVPTLTWPNEKEGRFISSFSLPPFLLGRIFWAQFQNHNCKGQTIFIWKNIWFCLRWTFWKSFQWDHCFPNGSSLATTSIRLFNPNIQKNR